LPDWFGKNTTIPEVEQAVGSFEHTPFFVAYDEQGAVGFICLKVHNADTAEIGMMAVLSSQHGKGIGKKLVLRCEDFCRETKRTCFTVKSLQDSNRPTKQFKSQRLIHFPLRSNASLIRQIKPIIPSRIGKNASNET